MPLYFDRMSLLFLVILMSLVFPRSILVFILTTGGILGLTVAPISASEPPLPEVVKFNRDVRPILSNSCFACHGPDAANNLSDLRLDEVELATAPRRNKAGRTTTAIVPGDPAASELWRRITSSDATVVMPPPDAAPMSRMHLLSPTSHLHEPPRFLLHDPRLRRRRERWTRSARMRRPPRVPGKQCSGDLRFHVNRHGTSLLGR
jgi:hypothetical protein